MIISLAHIAVRVSDLNSALEFYCDKIGLPEAFRLADASGKVFLVYLKVGNGTFVELFPGGNRESRAPQGSVGTEHFCIQVDNVEATIGEWRKNGVEPISGPSIGADNAIQAWFADPDGNRFEIHEYLPDSMQVKSL